MADHISLTHVATENARKMFHALTMLLQGPPLLQLKRKERGDGFEAWKLAGERYDGANASRLHHLQSIVRPKAFPRDAGGFEVALNEWVHLVQRWEVLASDLLNDAVRRQILLEMAQSSADSRRPPELRNAACCDHVVPCRFPRLGRGSRNTELHWSNGGGRTDHLFASREGGTGSGKSGSGKTPRKPAHRKNPATCAAKQDTTRKIAGIDRDRPKESRMARAKEKAKGKNSGKGEGKVNNISDEPTDSQQPVDLEIVGSVNREGWIMVLEREAPHVDVNTNNGFDVHAVTLRTASGHAPTSYGHCVLKLQVPPVAGTARVTFEVIEVCYPILSVAILVANGHRVLVRGQDAVLSTAAQTTAESLCWSTEGRHDMCARQLGLIACILSAGSFNRRPR